MESFSIVDFINKKRWFRVVLFTLLIFILMLSFWNQGRFGSDEEEIFVKGQQMARGQRLFVDIVTQHMPIMYHIADIFSRTGIETVAGFRAAFYLLFACLWGVAYWRFGKELGEGTVALTPIIYLVIISGISSGTCILSDQIQAIGSAYILFELLQFYKTRKINVFDCIFVSVGVFLSIFAAFVSVFSIFVAFIFVLMIESRDGKKEGRKFLSEILFLIKKYFALMIIVGFPVLLLFMYYDRINIFRGFIKWAYLFNREVYPRYIGGYGDNILSAFFGGIGNLFSALVVSQFSTTSIVNALFILTAILYLIDEYHKNTDFIFLMGIIFYVVTCSTRSVFGFHGFSALATLSVLCAKYLCEHIPEVWKKCSASKLRSALLIFLFLILTSNYLSKLPAFLSFTTKEYINTKSTAYALNAITDKGERVGFASLDYTILLQAGVTPASFGCSDVPWYWEWCGEQELAELNQNPPRVFLYAPDNTWGYTFTDYAPGVTQLINERYTSLSSLGYSSVYVLSDYYDEAVTKLLPNEIFVNANTSSGTVGQILVGDEICQTFTVHEDCTMTSIDVQIGTYGRKNPCTLSIDIIDNTSGKRKILSAVVATDFVGDSYRIFDFENQKLLSGHSYTLVFYSPDAVDGNAITIYCGTSDAVSNEHIASINGEPQAYDLTIRVNSDESLLPVIENTIE